MRWWISVLVCAAACAAGPVEFGKAELDAAMEARHIKYKPRIVAELNLDPPETFRIEPYAAGGAHITGGDLRGLMYGLLEAADQMRANGRLKQTHGTPAMGLRSVRMTADPKASWFGSEEFWRGYFAQMAHARFNRVQLEFTAIPERNTFVAMRMISQTGTQYGVDVALGLRSGGGAGTLRDLLAECPTIHSVVLENADAGAQALLVILHQAGRRVVLELNDGAADAAEADHLGVPLRRFAAYDAERIPPPQDFYWRIDPAQDPAILSAIPPEDGFEIPAPDNREVGPIAMWGRLGYAPNPAPVAARK